MAVIVPFLPAIFGAASVGMAYKGGRDAKKAAAMQAAAARKEAKLQQRRDDIAAARRRVAAAKARRVSQGEHTNISESSGVQSSAFQGFSASNTSSYASAVMASNQDSSLASQISIFNNQASAAAARLYSSSAQANNVSDMFKGVNTIRSVWPT